MSKIYEPSGRAREYSPLALNLYKGCTHQCQYCYVPRIFGHFNKNYKHEECRSQVDWNELENSAKKMQECNKQILLSFTGDPYCGVDPDTTSKALEILNKYNHKVAILTKGGNLCLNDLDLYKKFGDRIKIGATLTFDNDKDSLEWEPGAATPSERIKVLKKLAEEGIKTWVSFEPVIIPEQSLNLLQMVSDFIDHVKIGKINNYKGIDKQIDWQDFIKKAVKICRETNVPFYIKNDLAAFNNEVELSENEINQDFLNL